MIRNVIVNKLKCAIGQKKIGVDFGPEYLAKLKILNQFPKKSIEIKSINDFSEAYDILYNSNDFNINIGGDHSVGTVTVQAQLDKYLDELLVIWIDAHADVNTMESSITKNIHGMPVAPLLGLMSHWWKSKLVETHHILNPKNLLYIGIRDLDLFENQLINKLNIKYFTNYSNEIDKWIKSHSAKNIHISCDIDGIDPLFMPSTGTPVLNGLSVDDVCQIINGTKNRLVGFDLVEFNPLIGNSKELNKTIHNCKQILKTVL